jgi:hypothetical protein
MIAKCAWKTCVAVICLAILSLHQPAVAQTQVLPVSPANTQTDRPWWVSGEFGEGQLKLSSNQQQGDALPTFALGFAGGRQVGDSIRVGVKLNGWLLQAFNLNDPAVGESVSNVMGIVDVFPLRRSRLFFRGGLGWASYTNNQPTGSNGNGVGWETGAGYEVPLRGQLRLAPTVEYGAGTLGDAYDPVAPQTQRRYSVIEFKLTVVYRFGGHGE